MRGSVSGSPIGAAVSGAADAAAVTGSPPWCGTTGGTWGAGTATGGAGATPGGCSLQAPWAPGMRRMSSSSAACSEGSRKVYAPGAGMPGCSTMPAFSGSPSPETWPVSVMRTPRPSLVLPSDLRPSRTTSARAARHEGRADTHSLSRPSAVVAGRSATACCGLRHVARSPHAPYHISKPEGPPIQDIRELNAERPGAVQQSASLPAPAGRQGHGALSLLRPASRKTTERSRSDQSSGSSPTVWRRRLSTV